MFNLMIVTAGFHSVRALALLIRHLTYHHRFIVFPCPAYGPHTHPENWHQSQLGRTIIGDVLEKLHRFGLLNDTS